MAPDGHVLVVEDDAPVRRLFADTLRRVGWVVSEAALGREALERLAEMRFDAIVCDLDLGESLTGLDVLEQRPPLNAVARFVMLTGHGTDGRRNVAMARGASAFLAKPILPAVLLHALRPSADVTQAVAAISSDVPLGALRPGDAHVCRALSIIERRSREANFTVESLALETGVSPEHLARIFTKHTSVNPHEYIEQERMKAAKNMLRDLRLPITNIAIDCGYRDLGEFDRVFKRAHGCPPTEWRARQGLLPPD